MIGKLFKWTHKTDSDEVEKLKREVKELKEKLADRQQIINKTNAYWKKRLREVTKSNPQSKSV